MQVRREEWRQERGRGRGGEGEGEGGGREGAEREREREREWSKEVFFSFRSSFPEKNDVSARRKERAVSDKKKAKVNVMIKSKMSKRKKADKTRKRRNPNVIEYYEYDNDMDQENDELSPSNEQERVKNNYQDKNPIEFDAGLGNDACTSPSSKT